MGGRATGFQQGELDYLCGVYAVINSSRAAAGHYRHLSSTDCRELFAALLLELEQTNNLATATAYGMGGRQISRLLKAADRWLLDWYGIHLSFKKPFHTRRTVETAAFLGTCRHHLEGLGSSTILRLSGRSEHWTVLSGMTDRRLLLIDSNRRKYLPIGNVTIGPGREQPGTIIVPSGFYLITASTDPSADQ